MTESCTGVNRLPALFGDLDLHRVPRTAVHRLYQPVTHEIHPGPVWKQRDRRFRHPWGCAIEDAEDTDKLLTEGLRNRAKGKAIITRAHHVTLACLFRLNRLIC